MLEAIKKVLRSERVLHTSTDLKVVKTEKMYRVIETSEFGSSSLVVRIGDDAYDLEQGDSMEFSEDVVRNKNMSVVSSGNAKFVAGENKSSEYITVFVNEYQMEQIEDISVNRNSINDCDQKLEVYNMDGLWQIKVSDLMKNVNYRFKIEMSSSYPDIIVRNTDGSAGHQLDLTGLSERYLIVKGPENMSGEALLNKSIKDYGEVNRTKIPATNFARSSIYLYEDESVEEEIQRWNNHSFKVVIRPDNYVPVKRTVDPSEPVKVVEFNRSQFDEKATIRLEYPEYVDSKPWISYGETKYDDDIIPDSTKKYRREEDGTVVFEKSVIPAQNLRIFHQSLLWFEDAVIRTEISEGETKSFSVSPTQKRVEMYLNNELDASITVKLNDHSEYLSKGQEKQFETKIDDSNSLEIVTTDGVELVSENLSREDVIRSSNMVIDKDIQDRLSRLPDQ